MARKTPVNGGYTIINGTATGKNAAFVDVWLEYKVTAQSVTGNTSSLDVYLYAAATKSSTTKWTAAEKFGYVQCDGGDKIYRSTTYDFSDYKVNCFGHAAFTVPHGGDGTKTVPLAGAWSTGHSAYISGGSVSASVQLPAIARAATIGATDCKIGAVSMIAVTRTGKDFTHSVQYQFGSESGYIKADGGISKSQVLHKAESIAFVAPESFYSQIPNAPSGICTLTCCTYLGDTVIGTPTTARFTVTASRALCAPSLSASVRDVNPVTVALTGNDQKAVRYASTLRCSLSATAKNSASITKRAVNGVQLTGSDRDIPNAETATFTCQVWDSRGYSTDKTVSVEMIPYVALTNNATVSRDDPTSGNATIYLKGSYFNGSFGAEQNSLQVHYRIGSGSWQEAFPVLSGNSYTGTVALSGLDYTAAYRVEVKVSDRLRTVTKTMTLQKGVPVFDWGENDFQFHVPVTLGGGIAGDVSGVYIRTVRLSQQQQIIIQTRMDAASPDSTRRQSLLLFGNDNGTGVLGVAVMYERGDGVWDGTNGVTVTSGGNGQFIIQLPSLAYDYFTLISPESFSIL